MHTPELMDRIEAVMAAFRERFSEEPALVVRAPGRVNLIGEHTDYNEGFVFPAAINREMLIAASPKADTGDRLVELFSLDYNRADSFSLRSINRTDSQQWSNYLRGSLDVLQKDGNDLPAFRAVLSGNVPQGAGLSSSAAFEVAVIQLMNRMANLDMARDRAALLAQKAENEFIGVQCGIMDQFISALGSKDSALMIDCRSLEYRSIPLQLDRRGLSIVITNSGVSRGLVDSEYNTRRAECRQGVELMRDLLKRSEIGSLRDVSVDEFRQVAGSLPETVAMRCRHVITENQRVVDAVAALERGDIKEFGTLVNRSHLSLKDDFQVTTGELDILVGLTQALSGVVGSRMTGAGFGGCNVTIMATESIESFKNNVMPSYEQKCGRKAEVYVCRAVEGANIVFDKQRNKGAA